MSTAKSLVSDMLAGLRLDGYNNYDQWHRKMKYLLSENGSIDFITEEIKPLNDRDNPDEVWRYSDDVKKDRSARYLMLSCMADDLVHLYEDLPTAKAMWDALQKKYGILSETRLRALELKVSKLKCANNKGMEKHLLTLSACFANLKKAGHPYSNERKRLTLLNSLPDNDDWEQMHFSGMHAYSSYEVRLNAVEFEVERLKERAAFKSQSAANFVSEQSKTKSDKKKTNKRKDPPKPSKSESEASPGPSAKKKKARRGKKPSNGSKTKAKCHRCGEPGHFARDCTKPKKVSYCNSATLVCSQSLMVGSDSPLLWVVDSGASDHIACNKGLFREFRKIWAGEKKLYVVNGQVVDVLGMGTCEVDFGSGHILALTNVLYAPEIVHNLMSIRKLTECGNKVHFEGTNVIIKCDNGFNISGFINGNLYVLNDSVSVPVLLNTDIAFESMKWHSRLGHIGQDRMSRLVKSGLTGSLTKVTLPTCESCLAGKATRKSFGKARRASAPLDLIHSDICGPMSARNRTNTPYFITFIDDYSRYGHIYLISHKSEALKCFETYLNEVENKLERKVKTLRTDRGREYLSDQFKELCEKKGIVRQLTMPYTPQQNGVAERRNRTLMDMVRCMMAQASLPISFWGDALLTAAYLLNRVPSKSVELTPYELWTGSKPTLGHLRPWGCTAYVHFTSHPHGKLGPRAKKCIFLRYPKGSKGYVFLGENDDGTRTELESRNVNFLEKEFPSIGETSKDIEFFEEEDERAPTQEGVDPSVSGSGESNQGNGDSLDNHEPSKDAHDTPMTETQDPRRSQRGKIPRRYHIIGGDVAMTAGSYLDDVETMSYKHALSLPNACKWKEAMREEMESMWTNQVWDLVDLPTGRKAIGNKWVLKIKRNSNGSIERYKARLVAKGYTQREGIDYEETFSRVVRFASLRAILAIVAKLDLELVQMDIKTAFLHGELDEEIFMDQPEGFRSEGQESKVCRLKRSIYGLKQSSRQWYLRFHRAVLTYGFTMIEQDHCVYLKRSKVGFLILTLYVDDILMASNDKKLISETKVWLSSQFDMKDMGKAAYVLGVKILRDRSRRTLGLSQETYVRKVLERFNMSKAKPIDTPVIKNHDLSLKDCPKTPADKAKMASVPYASAIGSLMYAMVCTRPDLAYAVGLLSWFQSDLGIPHWNAVKKVLRYLVGTTNYTLCYGGSDLRLQGYTDADWAGDLDERKSTSAFVFMLNGGAISWRSKKQEMIALSMMEAEYIAAAAAVQEVVWLRSLLISLEVVPHADDPITLHSDSMSAIDYSKDSKFHGRTKHIEIKYHFVRNKKDEVMLRYLPTGKMVADPLTKPLALDLFKKHVKAMGLRRW